MGRGADRLLDRVRTCGATLLGALLGVSSFRGGALSLFRAAARELDSWSEDEAASAQWFWPWFCWPSDRSKEPRFPALRRSCRRRAASAFVALSEVVVWLRRFSDRRSLAVGCRPFSCPDLSFCVPEPARRFLGAVTGAFLLLTMLTVLAVSTSDSPDIESSPFFPPRDECLSSGELKALSASWRKSWGS